MKKYIILLLLLSKTMVAQNYWQQHVDYKMDIDVNVKDYQYKGKQTLTYTNNSPDDLDKVYYHLYYNAFQKGSQMDARLNTIADPDSRMIDKTTKKSRISSLKPNEIGYIKVNSLKQNGKAVKHKTVGTVLEVTLNTPIKAGEKAVFDMDFEAQIPVMIRRTGRNSAEGVALSMAQWYPKMAEYDFEGWHTPPYIMREFYGVWGNFDVTIHIDKNYILGGTGTLQNPEQIGYGYQKKGEKVNRPNTDKLVWHFKAENVHDFTWAGDPNYQHDVVTMANGIDLHFLYKKDMPQEYVEAWKNLEPKAEKLLEYYSKHVGQYPYKQYSVIQGGDGGMEYAQCTLVNGKIPFDRLFGTVAHEMAHTWFQFLLASNENKHPWMDEGFTTYISNLASYELSGKRRSYPHPHHSSYDHYKYIVKRGLEEPLTTNADRYKYNACYSVGAYSKGNIFLSQLEYIIGKENVAKTLKAYFKQFAFKHPTPNDFKRIAEKVSGIHLDWYLNEWTQTTHTIHYKVEDIKGKEIILKRIDPMPMPIDLEVTYTDGTTENFNIPLEMMRGHKPTNATILKPWGWAIPTYTVKTSKNVSSVVIDNTGYMANMNLIIIE